MEDANEHHVICKPPSPPASGRLRYATRQLGVDHERPRPVRRANRRAGTCPRERVPSGDELAELVIDMAGERDRAVLADWHRIAITEQQVERHQLPVISKPDRRYNPARWHEAVETEALGQTFIVNLVREWLDSLLPEPIEDVREREKRQRARMRAALARITRRR
jgi:hypothetical protein